MGFKLVIGPPSGSRKWPGQIRVAVPDCDVQMFATWEEAADAIVDADAAFGAVPPETLALAGKLRWIQAWAASPPAGYYYGELIESDVVVTNMRGMYGDTVGHSVMAFLLAFARDLHRYFPQQLQRRWEPHTEGVVYLPEATVLIIGMGSIGAEVARLCAAFGMTVVGIDPRVEAAPPGVLELHKPDRLHDLLPRADFVVLGIPETPESVGMFAAREIDLMKPTAYLINVSRGAHVVLADLARAVESGGIAGAGLDVFEFEPLPVDSALWTMPNVLITPHAAGRGPYFIERRTELFIDNCKRFNAGRPLRNVVDKAHWF